MSTDVPHDRFMLIPQAVSKKATIYEILSIGHHNFQCLRHASLLSRWLASNHHVDDRLVSGGSLKEAKSKRLPAPCSVQPLLTRQKGHPQALFKDGPVTFYQGVHALLGDTPHQLLPKWRFNRPEKPVLVIHHFQCGVQLAQIPGITNVLGHKTVTQETGGTTGGRNRETNLMGVGCDEGLEKVHESGPCPFSSQTCSRCSIQRCKDVRETR